MKIVCGGSNFDNFYKEPKERMYTLCGKFINGKDGADTFPEITCPDCMQSSLYEEWSTEYAVTRLKGERFHKQILQIVSIHHYKTQSYLRNQNAFTRVFYVHY